MLTGLDQLFGGHLSNLRRRLRSERLGVLTHAASVDRKGRNTLAVLDELGATPAVVFAPEHGCDGHAQAEEPVGTIEATDEAAQMVSLYGADKGSLVPSEEQLARLDLLVIDLCDVGSRYYTYVWTALMAARAAAKAGKHVLVLDRPNPISGDPATLEGTPQQADFLSFVGLESLPIRHALTIGELLVHFCRRDGIPLGPEGALSVVPLQGWERHRTAEAWGSPFVLPSPNMPTVETALVYPGACLLEGTNLSEGRGTTVPFQMAGAPFLDGEKLAEDLRERGVPGALVRPVSFRPVFNKHANVVCRGVMIHVTQAQLFRPVATYAALIALARAQAPEQFVFRTQTYEFEASKPAFDLLTGGPNAREALERGAGVDEVVNLIVPVGPEWTEFVRSAEAGLAAAFA